MYFTILRKINFADNFILDVIKKHLRNKYMDKLMPVITSFGNMGVIWIAFAVVLIMNQRYRAIGNTVILTLMISTMLGEGIVKHLVRRARPSDSLCLIEKPITYSFPSGHTFSSFAAAGILSMNFEGYKILFIGLAILIAFSRLYLYVHYPTDVLCGIVLGIMCSKMIWVFIN